MGAEQFVQTGSGATAQEAFKQAHTDACYNHGHMGYTGSLAEKDCFTEIPVPEGEDAMGYAEQLMDNDDERVDDKWGPAGCIKVQEGEYVFFGWASS